MKLDPLSWETERDERLPTLKELQKRADSSREQYLSSLKESMRPFEIVVAGRYEYEEDDQMFGSYYIDGMVWIDRTDTITEAVNRAFLAWSNDEWTTKNSVIDSVNGPVSFDAKTIIVRDNEGRDVVRANANGLAWAQHVSDLDVMIRIEAEQNKLWNEARLESGWDNHETARKLRAKAEVLGAGIVSEAWCGNAEVASALNSQVNVLLTGI